MLQPDGRLPSFYKAGDAHAVWVSATTAVPLLNRYRISLSLASADAVHVQPHPRVCIAGKFFFYSELCVANVCMSFTVGSRTKIRFRNTILFLNITIRLVCTGPFLQGRKIPTRLHLASCLVRACSQRSTPSQ
jgi:hypothetical protein